MGDGNVRALETDMNVGGGRVSSDLVPPFVADDDEKSPLTKFDAVLHQSPNSRIYLFSHDCV